MESLDTGRSWNSDFVAGLAWGFATGLFSTLLTIVVILSVIGVLE